MEKPKAEAPSAPTRPRRNAKATRRAILESARQAFTRHGYDGAGVREIAENAGVTAMLVNRYFGSKEKLFEEVVESALAFPGILKTEIAKARDDFPALCRALARALVTPSTTERNRLDGISLLIRSASNEQAAAILRQNALRHMAPLVEILAGGREPERAALFFSLVAGFQLMRRVIVLPSLNETDPSDLAEQLQALFERLLIGR
ncbi:TetR family transcriptional regulator [Fundidesulfovibrio butyratiphilus]